MRNTEADNVSKNLLGQRYYLPSIDYFHTISFCFLFLSFWFQVCGIIYRGNVLDTAGFVPLREGL